MIIFDEMIFDCISKIIIGMSTALDSFKLTQHTQFRTLEFEYSKLRDQNLTLKSKLSTLEEMYRNTNLNYIKEKQELKNQKQDLRQQIQQQSLQNERSTLIVKSTLETILKISNEIEKLQQMGINVGRQFNQLDHSRFEAQDIVKWIDVLWNCMLTLINKNNDLALKLQKQIEMHRTGERIYRKSENQLRQELNYLNEELQKIQKHNASLANQLNLVKRQNHDFKLQLYESARERQHNQSQSKLYDGTIQDNNFTVDLLHYQKELLQKITERILSTIQQEPLSSSLAEIYASYEKVSQTFREKLQVQYDLEDLERQYKRDKNSNVCDKLLIELRKQIEQFRNELHKQKDLLVKEENELEMCFVGLAAQQKDHKHIRSHTVQIQKQLNNLREAHQSLDSELPNRQTKREWEDSAVRSGSKIRFKASGNSEEMMKEVVKRDRENIEKLFKETRQTYLKSVS